MMIDTMQFCILLFSQVMCCRWSFVVPEDAKKSSELSCWSRRDGLSKYWRQ